MGAKFIRQLFVGGVILVVGIGPVFAELMSAEVRNEAMDILKTGLESDEFWPAMHAAEALTIAGEGEWVRQRLSSRLSSETDDQRRCGLAREITRAGDTDKAAVMIAILADPESEGRIHAAESLYKVGWPGDASPYLREVWHSEEGFVLQLMAVAALAKHGAAADRSEALAYLRQLTGEIEDHNHLRLVAWVLSRVGDDSDIARLKPILQRDLAPQPRVFVEHALARLGDEAGQAALRRNLRADDPATRTYAAVFAGESGMVETAPQLIALLDDPNLDTRIRAAQALFTLEKDHP
jgi:sialidase-1